MTRLAQLRLSSGKRKPNDTMNDHLTSVVTESDLILRQSSVQPITVNSPSKSKAVRKTLI